MPNNTCIGSSATCSTRPRKPDASVTTSLPTSWPTTACTLSAAGNLRSNAAVHRLVTVTLAGLTA
jgi:hypothetical protein